MMDNNFIAKATLIFDEAMAAGDALCNHCLHCGKCVHHGDDDLSVTMCPEAKVLNLRWELLKDAAIPYMEELKKYGSQRE
jgi:hypothetical protein